MFLTTPESTAEFFTPFDALVEINDQIKTSCGSTWRGRDYVQRAVNFMVYELAARTNDVNETETFFNLNNFFFGTKGFRISAQPLLIDDVLQEKQGAPIALSLLYIHIGMSLGLKLQLVNWPKHAVVRWEHESKARYVDLDQKGRVLTDDEMVAVLNCQRNQACVLAHSEALVQYLSYVAMSFRQNKALNVVITALNFILLLDPNNMRILLERALTKKEAGLAREALLDFKRYFSFVDMTEVPLDLRLQYEELLQC